MLMEGDEETFALHISNESPNHCEKTPDAQASKVAALHGNNKPTETAVQGNNKPPEAKSVAAPRGESAKSLEANSTGNRPGPTEASFVSFLPKVFVVLFLYEILLIRHLYLLEISYFSEPRGTFEELSQGKGPTVCL